MFDTKDILNSLSEIICVVDTETNKIVYMNKPAVDLLGDCIGKTRGEAFEGKLTVHKDKEVYKNSDNVTARIYSGANGTTYAIYSNPTVLDGKKVIIETAADISAAEEERKELKTRLEREHVILSCLIELHRDNPFDDTINYILSTAGHFLEAERVYLFKYDGVTMSKTHSWCAEGIPEKIEITQNLDAHIVDSWLETFGRHKCNIIEDKENIKDKSPIVYMLLTELDVDRVVTAPLYVNGVIIGFIGVDDLPAEKLSVGEMFFEALSDFISIMIERERSQTILRRLSYVDTLTGIYNRNKFIEDCDALSGSAESNIGVMFMDMNGLKEINDGNGHQAGDKALKCLAGIIAEVFGKECVYRVGGDEFVAICRGIDESSFNALVERLIDTLEGCEHNAAVGSMYADSAEDINEIIKIADEDMYRDKKYFYRNAGQSRRYRAKTDTFTAISTPEKIKNLIHDERFVIWFQPRFSVNDGTFAGSEALVRFFGEDDMIVSPLDFIPEMEDNNTIHLVDLYVFKHVCEYISDWIKKGKSVKPVSINISHATLRKPNIIENLMDIWYDYGFPKELLVIEVSEDQENGGIADITEVLAELKKCGFRLAIDNFGAKYADLYLFADLRFDILKLDGDMVYKIENDKKTQLLSTSIMQICHAENIKIVAAGVENEKEMDVLREIGCDEAQGYYFEKPMSWNKFEEKYL